MMGCLTYANEPTDEPAYCVATRTDPSNASSLARANPSPSLRGLLYGLFHQPSRGAQHTAVDISLPSTSQLSLASTAGAEATAAIMPAIPPSRVDAPLLTQWARSLDLHGPPVTFGRHSTEAESSACERRGQSIDIPVTASRLPSLQRLASGFNGKLPARRTAAPGQTAEEQQERAMNVKGPAAPAQVVRCSSDTTALGDEHGSALYTETALSDPNDAYEPAPSSEDTGDFHFISSGSNTSNSHDGRSTLEPSVAYPQQQPQQPQQLPPSCAVPAQQPSPSAPCLATPVGSWPPQLLTTAVAALPPVHHTAHSAHYHHDHHQHHEIHIPVVHSLSAPIPPWTASEGQSQAARDPPPPQPLPPVPQLLAVCHYAPEPMRVGRGAWRITDYDITRRICRNATSQVFKATCLHSGLPVALKVYFLNRVPCNVLHMLHREARLQAALGHGNVVMLYGAFQDDRHLVLVQEYAPNGNLHRLAVEMGRCMTEQQARLVVLQPLLLACTHMHARGIIHRDIKPDNILFMGGYRLALADFGVAINSRHERAVTRAGTAGYMAPEVCACPIKDRAEDNKDRPDLAYTCAVDIYAVGVLALWLLTGRLPEGPVPSHVSMSDVADTFPPGVSLGARDFILATMAEHPGDRPTALQLLQHPWMVGMV